MLDIQTLIVGQLKTNCYCVSDTASQEALIIDPGDDVSYIAEKISAKHLVPTAILATHGHFDHILGALELQLIYHVPFYVHPDDGFLLSRMKQTAVHYLPNDIVEQPPNPSASLQKKQIIPLGVQRIQILQTPGHTPGSVSFYCADSNCVFSGDTLFQGGAIGDWHHTYSDKQQLAASVARLLSLPPDTRMYPGHGADTSVQEEIMWHQRDM